MWDLLGRNNLGAARPDKSQSGGCALSPVVYLRN